MNIFRVAALIVIIFIGQTGSAGAASSANSSFVPRFELTGTVVSVAMQTDGKAIVAGDFATINGTGRYNLARINTDGTVDSTFVVSGVYVGTADYQVVAVQSDGKILVGGNLQWWVIPGGSIRQFLARLNSDGSVDETFDAGNYSSNGLNGQVKTLVLQSGGKVLIGGDFSRVNGADRMRIARLNADGSADTTFNPGSGANALVRGIALQADGKILAAGDFTTFAGTARGRLARMAADGALDTGFSPSANGIVYALAVQADGRIVIGGDFTQVAGLGRDHLARINADGSLDSLSSGGYFWSVKTVLPLPDNSVVVGGWNPVMIFNGYPTDHDALLMRYGSDGTALSSRHFSGKPTEVLALARRSDGKIIVGGNFRNLDMAPPVTYLHGLALLNDTLSVAQGFTSTVARNGVVTSLVDQGNGKVLVAGNFNLVNGQNHSPLVRLNPDASIDTAFAPPLVTGSVVSAAALSDGSIAIGGFNSIAGSQYSSVVRLTSSGSAGSSTNYNVSTRALAATPDSKVYVGGSADAAFRGVMRLNISDWLVDSTFAVGTGLSNSVAPNRWVDFTNAMVVQPDGKLLLVGQFDQFNGTSRSNVVRLNTDGSVDTGFVPPTLTTYNPNFPPEVFAVTLQADGKVLVGGYFHGYAGSANSIPGLLRLNTDGSVDTTFVPGFNNASSGVKALLVEPGGKILVGGGLQAWENNVTYNYFVRLNPDGSRDTSLTPSFSGTSVNALLIVDGRTLVGGEFYMADSDFRGSLAAYGGNSNFVFSPNWNLVGNSVKTPMTVATQFGDATKVQTVWKWVPETSKWAFYSPAMGDGGAAYATTKGYDFLTTINGGEGFWVNAKTSFTASLPTGTAVVTADFQNRSNPPNKLPAGWSLIAVGDNPTPSMFNNGIGVTAPGSGVIPPNLTTLWAWSSAASNWYFYAPNLDASGGLAAYITSKGYLNFDTKALDPTMGFWVNHP